MEQPSAATSAPDSAAAVPPAAPAAQPAGSLLDGGRLWPAVTDRLPVGLRGACVAPSRRAVAGLVVLALGVVAISGWLLLRNVPQSVDVGVRPVARTLPTPTASPSAAKVVLVDVAGKVRRPGVVTLPLGSRVADALRAAGGPLPGVAVGLLNLARPLADGEQVVVGLGGMASVVTPPSGGPSGAGSAGSVLDLNTAALADFDGLPGVGPVLAQRIVDWRTAHGPFTSVEQLREVSGIGDRRFEDLKARVRV